MKIKVQVELELDSKQWDSFMPSKEELISRIERSVIESGPDDGYTEMLESLANPKSDLKATCTKFVVLP